MAQAAPSFAESSGTRTLDGASVSGFGWAGASGSLGQVSARDPGKLNEDWACILNALPAGLLLLNEAGEVVFANAASEELFGRDVTGRLWRELIVKLFDPQPDDGHDISIRGGRRVSISTRPLPSGCGQLLLFSDVTETRQLQERIARRERLSDVGQMAAGLVHQIRTPVASAMLYAAQLATSTLPTEARRGFATKLLARLHELEALVRDLLVFARGGGLLKEPVPTDDLLAELPLSLSAQLEASKVSLTIENAGSSVTVRGNREALLSALQNPILNAMQAGARQVTVKASTTSSDWVDLCVFDDGAGIPADEIDRVFEAFHTTKTRGTGLGLAMVKIVAEAHGGRVWAERPHGVGTAIHLRLPREGEATSKLARLGCAPGKGAQS